MEIPVAFRPEESQLTECRAGQPTHYFQPLERRRRRSQNSKLKFYYTRIEILGTCLFVLSVLLVEKEGEEEAEAFKLPNLA